jgi:hypothetical protein
VGGAFFSFSIGRRPARAVVARGGRGPSPAGRRSGPLGRAGRRPCRSTVSHPFFPGLSPWGAGRVERQAGAGPSAVGLTTVALRPARCRSSQTIVCVAYVFVARRRARCSWLRFFGRNSQHQALRRCEQRHRAGGGAFASEYASERCCPLRPVPGEPHDAEMKGREESRNERPRRKRVTGARPVTAPGGPGWGLTRSRSSRRPRRSPPRGRGAPAGGGPAKRPVARPTGPWRRRRPCRPLRSRPPWTVEPGGSVRTPSGSGPGRPGGSSRARPGGP